MRLNIATTDTIIWCAIQAVAQKEGPFAHLNTKHGASPAIFDCIEGVTPLYTSNIIIKLRASIYTPKRSITTVRKKWP